MAEEDGYELSTRFTDEYEMGHVLGRGAFSVVRRCVHKSTRQEYAAKIIITWDVSINDIERLSKEIRICRKLDHPNIIRLYDNIQEEYNHYLIFELVNGGELFEEIVHRSNYSEADASHCIQQVLEGVRYLHEIGVVHRDLKPQNLLLSAKSTNAKIKLIDFGLAIEIVGDCFYGVAGTSIYLSPEMLKKMPYGRPVDVWACGVILYLLLIGQPPFWHYDMRWLYERIKSGQFLTKSQEWLSLTPEAQNLIQRMLTVDPNERITAAQALNHPWVNQGDLIAPSTHRGSAVSQLKEFYSRRKIKAAVITTMAVKSLSKVNLTGKVSSMRLAARGLAHKSGSSTGEEEEISNSVMNSDKIQIRKKEKITQPEGEARVKKPLFRRVRDACVVS